MVAAKPPQQLIMGFQSGSEIKFASVANLFCISLSGNPKGAMLTHENVVSDAAGVVKGFEVCRHVETWMYFGSTRT